MDTMSQLTKSLTQKGVLLRPSLRRAFRSVDRKNFVTKDVANMAYDDTPLPIGEGQTISQPYTVAFMLDLLEPKAGDVIMDVGSGSCWQSAILAAEVGRYGKVHAIEIVPSLCAFGRSNLAKYPGLARRVTVHCQNASMGLPEVAAEIRGFDRIIAAAEIADVPHAWRRQLKVGGTLVYPKAASIFREIKRGHGRWEVTRYPGFVFVPFVSGR